MDFKAERQKSIPKLMFIQCQYCKLCGRWQYSKTMEKDSPVKGHSAQSRVGTWLSAITGFLSVPY